MSGKTIQPNEKSLILIDFSYSNRMQTSQNKRHPKRNASKTKNKF